MDELHQIGLESIVKHLQEFGFDPQIVEGSVLIGQVGDIDLLCRCEVLNNPPGMHAAITTVGFEVSLSSRSGGMADSTENWSIRDIVVGLAHDRREGVVQATHTWCKGVFPPVHRACDPAPGSAEEGPLIYPFMMSTQVLETGIVTDWDVFLGPPQIGGPNADSFGQFLMEGKLLHLLMNALTSAAQNVRLHWVKVYVAFQPDGSSVFECKLDNEDWPEGVSALQKVRWPRVPVFVQYRQFLVMRPSQTSNPQVRERLEAFSEEQQQRRRSWWPFTRRGNQ